MEKAGYAGIDFAIMLYKVDVPYIDIVENGVVVYTESLSWSLLALYKIEVGALGEISYYGGGGYLYTSLASPSFPLFMDASIDAIGYGLYHAQIDVGVGVIEKADHLPLMGIH